jgi:hypothetical protein
VKGDQIVLYLSRLWQILATSVTWAVILTTTLPVHAQDEAKKVDQKPEPARPKELLLSPAPAPNPALKYRLLPRSSDLNPGDAAPIYLRLVHERSSEALKELQEEPVEWLKLPLDQFARVQQVKEFVGRWSSIYEQLGFGARRQTCDWNYSLPEQKDRIIQILLPDVQVMRTWIRVLAVKARLEITEHRWDDAARTLETGFAFSRHVGHGAFLINRLVGIACASMMLDWVEEWVAQPDAPNLYWALTLLPRPLIDLRPAIELEEKTVENMVPELTEVERPRTEGEWAAFLVRLHARLMSLAKQNMGYDTIPPEVARMTNYDLDTMKKDLTPRARPYLQKERGMSDTQLKAMCDDQAVALFILGRYRDARDDVYKAWYLPYLQSEPFTARAEAILRTHKNAEPPLALMCALFSAIQKVRRAEIRIESRVAVLRALEAIRMHAAAHGRALPRILGEITDVPVSRDPATGEPFGYRSDGDAVLLKRTAVPDHPEIVTEYRLRLRK